MSQNTHFYSVYSISNQITADTKINLREEEKGLSSSEEENQ